MNESLADFGVRLSVLIATLGDLSSHVSVQEFYAQMVSA